MNWPATLVAELAERRCIVVLGAGASASSLSADKMRRPPDWKSFLERASALVPSDNSKAFALDLISKHKLLDAAEIVRSYVNEADFDNFVREELSLPGFVPSELHQHVKALDPKLVVTTNYDTIYDYFCLQNATDGYNVCRYYESHGHRDIRSTRRVILKAHGCVSDPSKIVLTRTGYFRARRDYPGFFAMLEALFLTNTLLFIGCGLDDPDFQLLLENANISGPSGYPHYAVTGDDRDPAIVTAIRNTINVTLVEYEAGKHDQVPAGLKELVDLVAEFRATH